MQDPSTALANPGNNRIKPLKSFGKP